VPAIDPKSLRTAMDARNVTPKALATGTDMSLSYICDILAGRRRLKRNPGLRRRIADTIGVPVHWIESRESEAA